MDGNGHEKIIYRLKSTTYKYLIVHQSLASSINDGLLIRRYLVRAQVEEPKNPNESSTYEKSAGAFFRPA
jgi:hypothetical protein